LSAAEIAFARAYWGETKVNWGEAFGWFVFVHDSRFHVFSFHPLMVNSA
jgi:hypothetical protein